MGAYSMSDGPSPVPGKRPIAFPESSSTAWYIELRPISSM